jgi:hypothetical protein
MQTLLPTPEHLAARSAPHHGSAQLSCIATYTLPSRQPHQHSLPTKGTTVILFVQFIQERHDPIRFSCITSFLCPGLRDRGEDTRVRPNFPFPPHLLGIFPSSFPSISGRPCPPTESVGSRKRHFLGLICGWVLDFFGSWTKRTDPLIRERAGEQPCLAEAEVSSRSSLRSSHSHVSPPRPRLQIVVFGLSRIVAATVHFFGS